MLLKVVIIAKEENAGRLKIEPLQGKCEMRRDHFKKRPVLSATIHPKIKRTLVEISERTGMSVSQVTDEDLYKGLVEMQELEDEE